MAKYTKTLVALTGAALLTGAGIVGAKAYSGHGHGGGWHRGGMQSDGYGRGDRRGSFGDRQRGRGREISQEDFDAETRARFAKIDADSNGVLSVDEIKSMLENRKNARWGSRKGQRGEGRGDGQGAGRGQAGGMGPMQGRMMQHLDTDKDGKITLAELEAQVAKRFAQADLDGDGAITDADLPPMMRGRDVLSGDTGRSGKMGGRKAGGHRMGILDMLRQANTDNDGSVTQAEAMAAAQARFARMDHNGDGAIDAGDREAMQQEMLDYRVKRFIHRNGGDFTNGISKEQFEATAKERFATRDLDDDGELSGDELGRGHRGGDRMGRHMGGHNRHEGGRQWRRGGDDDDKGRWRGRDRRSNDSDDDNG